MLGSCNAMLGSSMTGISFPMLMFTLIGVLVTARFTASVAKLFYNLLIRGGYSLKKFGAATGAWAVVTGASDGIGKEFALQLASKGFNVFLLARSEDKLKALCEQIEKESSVAAKYAVCDFATFDKSQFEKLAITFNELGDIGVLVNNVGTNHKCPIPFLMESDKIIEDIVNVNILNTMRITRIIAPKMAQSRRGLIINIASTAGIIPQTLLSVYSGSKAFILSWSQALGKELEKDRVVVECIPAYFVVSSMSKIRKPTFSAPLPKHFVASVLSKIGNPGGANTPYTSSVFFSHGLIDFILKNVGSPHFWFNKSFSIQAGLRKRHLAKLAKLAENKVNDGVPLSQ